MRRITPCLVCGGAESRLLHASTYSGGVDEAHRYFLAKRAASAHGDIRACGGCGFVYTDPQFEPAEYDRIYSRIGADVADPVTAQGPGAVANERRFLRLRDTIAPLMKDHAPLLDFGCGDGAFLQVAARAGDLGFEIGAPGRRPGPRGSTILSGLWPELAGTPAMPWESQACVTAFDVFEHLPDLERDVELIRRVLRPGGQLFITVPNVGSAMARLAGGRWNMFLLEHLWYFSPQTMDRFLATRGFTPVAHQAVPYDASVGHVLKRLGESLGMAAPRLPQWLNQAVLPVPAGVMFAAYRRNA